MQEEVKEKKSLFMTIITKGIEALKQPFVIKRAERAFSSAADSIEEQILGAQADMNTAREQLAEAAKGSENLQSYIQRLIDLRSKVSELEIAKKVLEEERKGLFEIQ